MGSKVTLLRKLTTCSIPSQGSPISSKCRKRANFLHKPSRIPKESTAIANEAAPKMDEVKAIITLRSGKKVKQSISKPLHATKEQQEEELKRIVIKKDMMKKSMPPPFPQALRGKKRVNNPTKIFEVLRQVS